MSPFWKLSAAGFAATAITYGPARMGFGLFLSEFRSSFAMSTEMAGLVSSLGFLGMLTGLVAAYAALVRFGPKVPVLHGLCAATIGLTLVAVARDLGGLAAGVILAMSSAGFAWSPFNNIVNRGVEDAARPAALSIVSTGTSLGIAAAGATAILLSGSGLSWRIAWVAFAVASAGATIANLAALRKPERELGPSPFRPWGVLLHASAVPLYGISLSFGMTTAIYISFAADRIEQAGGLPVVPPGTSSAVIFLCFGVFGLVGLVTGRAARAIGLSGLLRLLMFASAVSLALVAVTPTSWAGVTISAGLQGAFVMMMSAILSFWSERLFPEMPARSFTAALMAVAAGSVIGPVAAGVVAGAVGVWLMFLATAMIPVATVMLTRLRSVTERRGMT